MSNIGKRIIFAIVAIPAVLALVVKGGMAYLGLTFVLTQLVWWEYSTMLKKRGFYTKTVYIGYLFILLVFSKAFQHTNSWAAGDGLIVSIIVLLFLYELKDKNIHFSISRVSVQLMGLLYISSTGFATYLLCSLDTPGWRILIPFLGAIWLSDTFAYVFGNFLGRRPLNSKVSPNKTVEGFVGGLIGSVTGFTLYYFLNGSIALVHVLIVGFGIGATCQLGDLMESLIKRWANVKDSSRLIPGHGGVFDRVDGLLLAAPFMLVYFRYFL